MSVKTGLPGPWLQPSEYSLNESGQFATVAWEDVDPDKINSMAAQFDAQGFSYRVTHNFGKHRLELYLSYNPDVVNEVPVSLWEYIGNEVQKNVLAATSPASFVSIASTLTVLNVEVITKALSGQFPDKAPIDAAGVTHLDASCFTDGNAANALKLYNMMQCGVDDVIVQAPTLRHTQIVSLVYPLTLSKINVGRILTTSTLVSMENPPNWATNGVPNDPPPPLLSGFSLAYGWRKGSPHIQQIARQKTQLIQEFQYGLFSPDTAGPFL